MGAYLDDEEAFDWVREEMPADKRSPAAEVMDWADDVTYAVHDMEDFFRAGLVPLDRLCTSTTERDRLRESFRHEGKLNGRLGKFDERQVDDAVDRLFDLLDFTEPYLGDALQRQRLRERSSFLIREYMHAFRMLASDEVRIDQERKAQVAVLKELIWFYVIKRQELATVQQGQRRVIEALAEVCWKATKDSTLELFPPLEQAALQQAKGPQDEARVVVDFIARLTEERALELHRRMIGVSIPALVGIQH